MADNQRSGFQKLGDLLETRVDVLALLRELLFEPAACSRLSRHSFGYIPAIVRPARRTSPGTGARIFAFPARQSKTTKAV
ncbi:MAG TPA: hypothetical protein VNV88_11625 [Candidatus Solibacter sp.]|nr:hypothetical protein [Candidatus Solibacter sp.]